eukprot:177331-Alexandrium_andersonii.AAC.1
MAVDEEGGSRSRGAASACERPAPGAEPSEFAASAAVPAAGMEPRSAEAGWPSEASTGGPQIEGMPMPAAASAASFWNTEPTYTQRMQAFPPVPIFGPGQAGFVPPFRGSVAAATPIAAPKAKARLLTWKDVEEKLSLIHI